MQLKYIKQSIKNNHACNGSKNTRNSYKINVTNKDRYIKACDSFKQSVNDSLKDLSVNSNLEKFIYKKAIKAGLSKQQINKIGTLKLIQLLK